MLPALRPGGIVLASGWHTPFKAGDIVVAWHNGLEKIKRIEATRNAQVYLVGDNPAHSTDSRAFGWLDKTYLVGKVVWPRRSKTVTSSEDGAG